MRPRCRKQGLKVCCVLRIFRASIILPIATRRAFAPHSRYRNRGTKTLMESLPYVRRSKEELDRDLGLGTVVARESRRRLLNRDGSFNVARTGLSWWASLNLYHWLLTIS